MNKTIEYRMNTDKQGTTPEQRPAYYSDPGLGKDEISLLDIWEAITDQWKFIAGVTFAMTLIALIFSIIMPKIYQAEVVLLPPLESDVEVLNIPDLYEITTDELYQKMIRNLQSHKLRYRFFEENKLFEVFKGEKNTEHDSYEIFQKKFNDLLVVQYSAAQDSKLESEVVTVTLDGAHYDQITSWINKYVSFVNAMTAQNVLSAIDSKRRVQATSIQREIDSLREIAEKQRFDSIKYFNEAISVAENLGLNEQDSSLYLNNLSAKGNLGIVLNVAKEPLYTRGSKALKAKVKVLKSRKDDDPFIEGLRELEGKLSILTSINLKNLTVHAARVDQQAMPDDIPIKPKQKLIIVFGFVVGVMLAVLMVMIRKFFLITGKRATGAIK